MLSKGELLAHVAVLLLVYPSFDSAPSKPNSGQFWFEQGRQTLLEAVKTVGKDSKIAKNVIIFIGDGMGPPTLTAARIYKGQRKGLQGEEDSLVWEHFNHMSAIKTYCADRQVPDSASTATALLSGIKSNFETVGLDSRVLFNVCDSEAGAKVESIMTWAQAAGKGTGIVTTTRVTHATPSAAYGHSVNRYWEADTDMPPEAENCKDLARQLMEDKPGRDLQLGDVRYGNNVTWGIMLSFVGKQELEYYLAVYFNQVIFGGGAGYFVPESTTDIFNNKGYRKDNHNLIETWKMDKKGKGKFKIVSNKDELADLDTSSVNYVLGLFNSSHMTYDLNRTKTNEPSLAEMTQKAIEVLSKNKNGYILLVEGGMIDLAHHANYAHLALADTVALDAAVAAALNIISLEDTLIIVTADHSHAMGINGYPLRGNSILGIALLSDVDNMPFTTLLYHTGLGYNITDGHRPNITGIDTADINYKQLAAIPTIDASHGGEDVLLFAEGPKAELFFGVKEQNYVNHVMAYAAQIGVYCSSNHE